MVVGFFHDRDDFIAVVCGENGGHLPDHQTGTRDHGHHPQRDDCAISRLQHSLYSANRRRLTEPAQVFNDRLRLHDCCGSGKYGDVTLHWRLSSPVWKLLRCWIMKPTFYQQLHSALIYLLRADDISASLYAWACCIVNAHLVGSAH